MRHRYFYPANAEDFERVCLRLLQALWKSPHLTLYGRSGQSQHGVDIVDSSAESPRRAAQCKLLRDNRPLRIETIRAELSKLAGFASIDEYWILTTGKRTTDLQDEVLTLNQEQRAKGHCLVHVLSWDDIEDLLNASPDVRKELAPFLVSADGVVDPASVAPTHRVERSADDVASIDGDPLAALVHLAARDRLVVILGDVLDPEVALSRDALAAKLSADAGLPSPDLFVAGSVLESRHGRQALVDSTQQMLVHVKGTLTRAYQSLAGLPISTVVSLFPDPVLELALTSQSGGYRSIVLDGDKVVRELEPGRRELFLLGGSARFGTGLTLTQADYEGVLDQVTYVARGLGDRLALRAILLVGCDLQDQRFRKLFYWMTRHRTRGDGRIFVTGTAVDDRFGKEWSPTALELSPSDLLGALSDRVEVKPRTTPSAPRKRQRTGLERPYKYLDYYTSADSDLFFGREEEVRQLASEVLSAPRRITVLCGRSGVGKTSIIQAGLIPLLEWQHDLVVRYTRCGSDPVASIIAAIAPGRTTSGEPGDSLSGALQQAYTADPRLQVICIDQFEEALIKLSERVLIDFAVSLETALSDRDCVTRFVIAIREDFLSRLATLGTTVVGLLGNTYPLDDLPRENAYAAITGPAQLLDIRVEEGLAEAILDDLSPSDVLPAHLQIVCDRVLGDKAGAEGLTLAAYKGLGRASGILASHLERSLKGMPDDLDAAARSILTALVTSERTKDLLTAGEVAARTGLDPKLAARVIQDLIHRCRLVREVRGKQDVFELSHESLAASVALWLDTVQKQTRAVQDLLDQEVTAANRFPDHVIGRDRLRLIEMHRSALYLRPQAVTLVAASHAVLGEIPAAWYPAVNALSQDDRNEALLYRPIRSRPHQAQEFIARRQPLPVNLPPDIHEAISDHLRVTDVNSLLRILPALAESAPTWEPDLGFLLEALPTSHVVQCLSAVSAFSRVWAAAVCSRAAARSESLAIPRVASALLADEYRELLGDDIRRELALVLRRVMTSDLPAQRDTAHAEAARLFVQDPGGVALQFKDQIDAEAVFSEATSGRDLAAPAISYLFKTHRLEHVSALFRSMTEDAVRQHAALEQGVRQSDNFGWRALAAELRGAAGNEELIGFAARVAKGAGPQASGAGRAQVIEALCAVVPALSFESLIVVARCIAGADEAAVTAFIGRLPALPANVLKELLRTEWPDWWWVAASLLNPSNGDVTEPLLTPLLPHAVESMSTRAMVSLLESRRVVSYRIAVEIARSPVTRPESDRRLLVAALATPAPSARIPAIVILLAKMRLEMTAERAAEVEAALIGVSDATAADVLRSDPSEAKLILEAVHSRLVATGALTSRHAAHKSAFCSALIRFRGRGPEGDHLIGQVCAIDPIAAARSLTEGVDSERAGVLDGLLASGAPPFQSLLASLRRVGSRGDRIMRVKALVLVLRSGDLSVLADVATLIKPSKHGSLPPNVIRICRDEMSRVVLKLEPAELSKLTSLRALNDLLLVGIAETRPEILLDDTILAWTLKTLADLDGERASDARHRLIRHMEMLRPRLTALAESGSGRRAYQARQLLSLSDSAQSQGQD